ncbi:MAG: hypothetical protein AB8D78_15665 [Akkermansiaceae bacterium]
MHTFLIVFGFVLAGLPCLAQQQPVTKLRFVTFPVYMPDKPIELFLGDGKSIPIVLPTNSLSETYDIKIRQCILGKPTVDDEGNPSFITYGQTPLLSSKEQIILVTRKGEKPSDGFKLTAFAGGQNGFGGGKYLMMNAAKVDIAGNLGASKFSIKPNQHILLAPKPSKVKNNRKYLFTKIYFRKDDVIRPFYTSTWRFSEMARCMVFFHHDEHTNQLRTHTIRNYLE